MIGRLELPDLSTNEEAPIFPRAAPALPVAVDGRRLILTDSWYYLAIDPVDLRVLWRIQIKGETAAEDPALRFALKGNYFAVTRRHYDRKVISVYDSRSGRKLWSTDPRNGNRPAPLYSMRIEGETVIGIQPIAGQAFRLVGYNAADGKTVFKQDVKGYADEPVVELYPRAFGRHLVARVSARNDFELRVFNLKQKGKTVHSLKVKSFGARAAAGGVSDTVQSGRTVVLKGMKLRY
jgi:hypothetical protein